MRMLSIGGCLAGLALGVLPARATFINVRTPVPELVGGAEVIVVGKVAKIQNELISVLPTRDAVKKGPYQIVEVTVGEALQGAKGLSTIKVGIPCSELGIGGVKKQAPLVMLAPGQEACFFLRRHHGGEFFELGLGNLIFKDLNGNFAQELEQVRKCVKLLAQADESLKSDSPEERFLTAAMLIRKYRGPLAFFPAPARKAPKEEPIAGEQSKRILKALEESDWTQGGDFNSISPANLFRRLGLKEADGWRLKQKPAISLDPRAVARADAELVQAARTWLKANAEKYRIKRIVEEPAGKPGAVKDAKDQGR
jgi:hypothetical protein